jgi:hypothetical protein
VRIRVTPDRRATETSSAVGGSQTERWAWVSTTAQPPAAAELPSSGAT